MSSASPEAIIFAPGRLAVAAVVAAMMGPWLAHATVTAQESCGSCQPEQRIGYLSGDYKV